MNRTARDVGTVAVFCAVIVFLLAAVFVLPDEPSSDLENRELAQRPALPSSVAKTRQYFRAWDEYMADQIPFREDWVKAYYFIQLRGLSKSRLNNVAIGSNGYLLRFNQPAPGRDLANVETKLKGAADLAAKLNAAVDAYGGRLLFVGVPEKSSFERAGFPAGVEYSPLREVAERGFLPALTAKGLETLDLSPLLESNRDQQLYYLTDHHWTFAGAFLSYTAVMRQLGLPPLTSADLTYRQLDNPFVGSEAKMLGNVLPSHDRFSIGVVKHPVPFRLTVNGKLLPEGTPYYELPKDTSSETGYGVYRYASQGEVVVDTDRADLPDLLLVGDSFKAAVEPLLYGSFGVTRQLDLRSYRGMSLLDYVAKHKPEYVVFLLSGPQYLVYPWNAYDQATKSGVAIQD